MSFLRSVRTSYNPTLHTFHADGSPSEIDLNLAFTEYKTLDRSDVLNEDDESFYDMTNKRPKFSRANPSAGSATDLDANPNIGVVGGV